MWGLSCFPASVTTTPKPATLPPLTQGDFLVPSLTSSHSPVKTTLGITPLYFNFSNKPDAFVREQMQWFMADIANHFGGARDEGRTKIAAE